MNKIRRTALALLTAGAGFSTALGAGGDFDFENDEQATHYPAMVLADEDDDIEEVITRLEEQGVTVLRHRENILLVYIPVDADIESQTAARKRLRGLPGVKDLQISKPRRVEPTMNIARGFHNAGYIHEGRNLPQPYDGSGVVVGVCDIGIDVTHPNFLDKTGGECRVRQVSQYEESFGRYTLLTDPAAIADWRTDDAEDWHGTHVTGIAAGAYGAAEGEGFYGMAPGAEIVVSTSMLSDVGLLAGVEDIIDYANEAGKPCVINLSMGNYVGPHDGTSLFTRYLDLCADDAIICLSAGNEGSFESHLGRSMSYDFTEEAPSFEVRPNDYGGTDFYGQTEVWSADDTPFSIEFYYRPDGDRGTFEHPYAALRAGEGEKLEWRMSADPDDPDYDERLGYHYNEGYMEMEMGISPLNGRYYAALSMELKTDKTVPNRAWAAYWPALKIDGEPGAHVDVFSQGSIFLHRQGDSPAPDNNMCISDLTTGFRTISVGSLNNIDLSEGAEPGSGRAAGDASYFTSYGTLLDGRVLPLTLAPGALITSSVSGAFMDAHPEMVEYTDASATVDGKEWYWVATQGTSMACPFVVGTIACWLEAYPQLTVEQAQEIILETNRTTDLANPEDPHHGLGHFEPYAGLLKVLDQAVLNVTTIDEEDVRITVGRGEVTITNPTGRPLPMAVYSTDGVKALGGTISGVLETLSLDGLAPGVYVIRVGNKTAKISHIR